MIPPRFMPYVDEPDPVYAQRILDQICEELPLNPRPRIVMGTGRDGQKAIYHPASRTIVLSCARRDYLDTIIHEVQHHRDELVGQSVGGQRRGVHDGWFYRRLDETRAELGLSRLLSEDEDRAAG